MINPLATGQAEIMCEQAFMFLKMDDEVSYLYKLIAIEKLGALLNRADTRDVLRHNYSFTEKEYYLLSGQLELVDAKQRSLSDVVIEGARRRIESKSGIYNLLKNVYSMVSRSKRRRS